METEGKHCIHQKARQICKRREFTLFQLQYK